MRLKKLCVLVIALVAFSAVAAANAFAGKEFLESPSAWYTGTSPGTKLAEGTTKPLTLTAVGTQGLETSVGGVRLFTTVSGVECLSCSITNVGTKARATMTLKLTGITVVEPSNCEVVGAVESKPLTATIGMNKAGTVATIELHPASGTTWWTKEVVGTKCSVAGLYKVTGTVFGQATNATGVFASSQEFTLSKAIQEAADEPKTGRSLKFGEQQAFMIGSLKGSIGGTSWAVKEK